MPDLRLLRASRLEPAWYVCCNSRVRGVLMPRRSLPFGFVVTIAALVWPSVARAGEPLNGAEIVRHYREVIESYRRHDPAGSAEGHALVLQAARWDLDVARMAALLAAMRPPDVTTEVRLDGDARATNGKSGGGPAA